MKSLILLSVLIFFSSVSLANPIGEWIRGSLNGILGDTLNKTGLGVLIDARYKKEKEIYKMVEDGRIQNINYDGHSCEFIIAPDPSNPEQINNLAIEFSNDQGNNNRAQFYTYNPNITRRNSSAIAGIIFEHPKQGERDGHVRCRSTYVYDLDKEKCPGELNLTDFTFKFMNSKGKNLYSLPHNEVTEYAGAMGHCCNNSKCIAKALGALKEREHPKPGFFQRLFNPGSGSQGTQ